jgi:cytochrome o ubiquinol oxidase subunit 1
MKKQKNQPKPVYTDIWVPKNSGMGVIIGVLALGFGVAAVWHMWWLLVLTLVATIVVLIIRLTNDDTERKITAKEVAETEAELAKITRKRQAVKEALV